MTKKFATTTITNELKGSVWFRQPTKSTPPPTKSTKNKTAKTPKKRSSVQPVPKNAPVTRTKRSSVQSVQSYKMNDRTSRTAVQVPKNTRTVRRAYEMYEYQISGLRRIRATRELSRDTNVKVSEIVREAVDMLLEKEGIK